jgi:hypothetical protein
MTAWGGALFRRVVRPTFRALRRLGVGALERRARIRTHGRVDLDELNLASLHRVHYEPSPWLALRRVLPQREVGPDDVLIDLGSGKGRIVYQAAKRYDLARVIGVELSAELTAAARENLAGRDGELRCTNIERVTADALEYELPDDVTIIYLANPFAGPVFAAVVQQMLASQQRRPRTLRVVYFNPVEEQQLLDAGFEVRRRLRGLRPTAEWSRSNAIRLYARPPGP